MCGDGAIGEDTMSNACMTGLTFVNSGGLVVDTFEPAETCGEAPTCRDDPKVSNGE